MKIIIFYIDTQILSNDRSLWVLIRLYWEYRHKSVVIVLSGRSSPGLRWGVREEGGESGRRCADEWREEGVNLLESRVRGGGERRRIEETGVHDGEERRVEGEESGVRGWEECPLSGDDCEELDVFDPINLSKISSSPYTTEDTILAVIILILQIEVKTSCGDTLSIVFFLHSQERLLPQQIAKGLAFSFGSRTAPFVSDNNQMESHLYGNSLRKVVFPYDETEHWSKPLILTTYFSQVKGIKINRWW